MAVEHYFTNQPAGPFERIPTTVELRGWQVSVFSAPGVFSAGELDAGTDLLLRKAPPPSATGNLLDLGCGWGPVALTLAHLAPDATVWAVDVNTRALELTTENAANLGLRNITVLLPQDVPPDLRFHTIWSNPPIRIGKAALHELLTFWLSKLHDDGEAWLVVNRNLGGDSLRNWLENECSVKVIAEKVASSKGFRILRVRRALGGAAPR
ncbi:MAG: methyltransferase [Promicromonosporaceae bacterium]|nr:methyltransferase [Promicromonosporaceae bacterium]